MGAGGWRRAGGPCGQAGMDPCGRGARHGPWFGRNAMPQAPRPESEKEDVSGASVKFLKDVGQQVAAALSQLGIDVDIDVEHKGNTEKVTTPPGEQAPEQPPKENKTEPTAPPAEKQATVPTQTPVADTQTTTEVNLHSKI